VLAYFGYPQAHEEDAEQAVRAGLALIEAMAKLDAGQATSLQVRVGIATGLVVVGDLLGEGAAQEQAVIGETPNLAARLQALAEPNTVIIADNTRRILGGLFEYRDLGILPVTGIDYSKFGWPELCPVVFHLPGGWLVVMPRAAPLSDEQIDGFDFGAYLMPDDGRAIPAEPKGDSFGIVNGRIVAIDYGSI
jgi:hypothetical protein